MPYPLGQQPRSSTSTAVVELVAIAAGARALIDEGAAEAAIEAAVRPNSPSIELQVALAVRGAEGSLRLGGWQVSIATEVAAGFVLSGASLR